MASMSTPANTHIADPKATKYADPAVDATTTTSTDAVSSDDAAVNVGTVMARNRIHISDSRIVLAAQDKKALLRAIADAVLARRVNLRSDNGADGGDAIADKAAAADNGADDKVAANTPNVKANAKTAGTKAVGVADDSRTTSATPSNARTKTVMATKGAASAPRIIITPVLFSVSRDAFLYYVPDPQDATKSIVRLGWRYSLADWKLYRALLPPTACEVKRTIGNYYYC